MNRIFSPAGLASMMGRLEFPMHARRKFYEARTSDPTRSHTMLARVAGLYEVEEEAKKQRKKHPEWDDATWHAYRHDLRSRRSLPILEAIHAWLEAERPKVLPKSPMNEAIGYALRGYPDFTYCPERSYALFVIADAIEFP